MLYFLENILLEDMIFLIWDRVVILLNLKFIIIDLLGIFFVFVLVDNGRS